MLLSLSFLKKCFSVNASFYRKLKDWWKKKLNVLMEIRLTDVFLSLSLQRKGTMAVGIQPTKFQCWLRNKSDQNVEENCKYDSFYEREGNPYIRFN